jgi:hypothetical protein
MGRLSIESAPSRTPSHDETAAHRSWRIELMNGQFDNGRRRDHESARPAHSLVAVVYGLVILGTFFGLVYWFGTVDFYHKHFFTPGPMVLAYNLFRIGFVLILAWLIYAPGHAVIAAVVPAGTLLEFSLAERFVFGFGAGVGLWHVLLLILGLAGLYHRSVLTIICGLVLAASLAHLGSTVRDATARLAAHVSVWRTGQGLSSLVCVTLIALAAAWLLLVRGLYPGGGGDYFTHYFYYYQDVVKNHGLAPNDVWYQYFYSKGAGLFFLGIMLTDPQAPELVTFCCVAAASLALAALSWRIAPNTIWPAVPSVLYLISYGVALVRWPWMPDGEFQKPHEEMSALVVMITLVVCMYRMNPSQWRMPCLITGALASIGAVILTPAIGVFLGSFFGLGALVASIRKDAETAMFFVVLCVSAGGAVAAILLLNYLVTGLATDQALDSTWRFSNLDRLDDWGVIPLLAVVAWIRDNYESVAPPLLSWGSVAQLWAFLRIDVLWPLLAASGMILIIAFRISGPKFDPRRTEQASQLTMSLPTRRERTPLTPATRTILTTVGSVLLTFAVLSFLAGRSQAISYFRFSTFFLPLLALFGVTCWCAAMEWLGVQDSRWARIALPLALLVATPVTWIKTYDWWTRARLANGHSWRFAVGKYSLAEAYSHSHQEMLGAFPFGGINPGALTAMRQLPPETRIWSTSTFSYCAAPGCRIESVVSFRMSPRLNEVLNGSPEQSRNILQQEGLNYFLFSKELPLLDLLPYSRLFAIDEIAKHLAIKWTDGSTYLLTWPGPETKPIDAEFLDAYRERLQQEEHEWFRFAPFLPHIDTLMKQLEQSPRPWQPPKFPWRR